MKSLKKDLVTELMMIVGIITIGMSAVFASHGGWWRIGIGGAAMGVGTALIERVGVRRHMKRAYPHRWVCDRCPAGLQFIAESNVPEVVLQATANHLHWHNVEGT